MAEIHPKFTAAVDVARKFKGHKSVLCHKKKKPIFFFFFLKHKSSANIAENLPVITLTNVHAKKKKIKKKKNKKTKEE